MNTPTHVMLSIAVLSRRRVSADDPEPSYVVPAVIGAVLPDAPMFVFYAVEKLVIGSSEREIWTTRYFLPAWQDFFDLFNSIPIVLAGLWICWQRSRRPNAGAESGSPRSAHQESWARRAAKKLGLGGAKAWTILFASMLLHMLADLPLHHDDGHRHFWPISNWRFESPVSYWDPNHYGLYAGAAELVLFVSCYFYSLRKQTSLAIRIGLTCLTLVHLAVMGLAIAFFAL